MTAFKDSANMKRFLRRNWGAPFVIGFMILLIIAAVELSRGLENSANEAAMYSFYLLMVGVGLQAVSLARYAGDQEPDVWNAEPPAMPKSEVRLHRRRTILAVLVVVLAASSALVVVLYNYSPSIGAPSGLVGYWPMDGQASRTCSGASVSDLSHNNNTGTCVNSPTWTTGPFAGSGALNFVGPSEKVTLNPNSGLPSSAFTISLWVQVTTHTASDILVQNSWALAVGDWVIYGDMTNWQFGIHGSGGIQTIYSAHSGSTTWHMLTLTYDGSTTMQAYVDGALVGTNTNVGTTTILMSSLQLGASNSGSVLNEAYLRIYNCALSASEVSELYSAQD